MNTTQKKKQLKYLNCYTSVFTTYKQAIKNFQRTYGLVVDGLFGTNTEKKSVLVWKDIQSKLANKGYSSGSIDGIVGNNTINAIKKFQKAKGLVADGIVGSKTLAKLNEISIYMTDEDWKNSTYFKKEEFECGCLGEYCEGYGAGISKQLITDMNKIRKHYGKPITITSGVRCQKYNNSLKGSVKNSKHIEGKACDFWFSGMNKQEVIEFCKTLPSYGYAYTNEDNMKYAVHYNTNE